MKLTHEEIAQLLLENNIKPSYQRIRIMEYLIDNRIHPTVEDIFNEVHKDVPTLSKATVYNTLHLFIDAGLLRVITIDEHETRYEIGLHDHGHFKCNSCGKIYDFDVNPECLSVPDSLNNFEISEKNVYFKGICPGC